MKKSLLLLVAGACFLTALPVREAQGVDAGSVQKGASDVMEYYRLEKKLEEESKGLQKKERIEMESPPIGKELTGDGTEILVTRIVTNSSEVLSPEEIRTITGGYEGKRITIRGLSEIVNKINDLYRAKSNVIAKAILPPQKVENGVVNIQLIEAKIGALKVENNKYTRSGYFLSGISQQSGELIRVDALERDLQFFNGTNDVSMTVELKPGREVGQTDLTLKVLEPKNYNLLIFTDNAGREATGLYRIGAFLSDYSVLGYRDALTLGGIWANGTLGRSASYNIPVSPYGTRFGVSYDYSTINILPGTFQSVDVAGDSSDLGLTLRQPLLVRERTKVGAHLGFHVKKSATEFAAVTVSSVRGETYNLGLDFTSFGSGGYWYASAIATTGLYTNGVDKDFFKGNAIVIRQQALAESVLGIFRAGGQFSDTDLLPSAEQFQLGGVSTVRGFPEGLLSGDDGYLLSAELQFPFFFRELGGIALKDMLRNYAFIDHGGAFPFKGAGNSITSNDYLTGAGFGVIMNLSKYLSGKLSVGFPIGVRDDEQRTARIHFYVQSSPF